MERGLGWCELVDAPEAFFLGGDQAGLSKCGEMTRGRGLGDIKHGNEVAYAHGLLVEQVEDTKAGAVGEGAKHDVEGVVWHAELYSLRRI